MKKRQLMILTLFVSGLTGSIPVIKAQEWRLMSREEIEAKVHPVLLEQAGEFLHFVQKIKVFWLVCFINLFAHSYFLLLLFNFFWLLPGKAGPQYHTLYDRFR